MAPITINGNTIEPQGLGTGDAADSNYILIQATGPLTKANKTTLRDLNVGVQDMVLVGHATYLCRYEPSDLKPIRDLEFVSWANVYPLHLVVSSKLKAGGHSQGADSGAGAASAQTPLSSGTHNVDVVFHAAHGKDADSLMAAVAAAAHVDASGLKGKRDKVRMVIEDRYLEAVAKIDEVQSIEEVHQNKLFNNIARNIIMGAGDVSDLRDIVIGSDKIRGQGQLVAVADTGLDSDHPAFRGRIKNLYALGRPELTDDPEGHGTHVCGSVLGNGVNNQGEVIQGMAPEAHLVMQSVGDDQDPMGLSGIPANLEELFTQPYINDGARIHSDSWGDSDPGYNKSAMEIDKFVYEQPDMVICFAAGNAGVDMLTGSGATATPGADGVTDIQMIGSQSAAKNCITVGASENFRPDLELTYGDPLFTDQVTGELKFGAPPISFDKMADNSEGMAAFSSRGPTAEGRLKPDIVAPGTGILSARSSEATDRVTFGKSPDPQWKYDAGTSMATPLVAGCAAILHQALAKTPPSTPPAHFPTAALIKALLINGAVDLQGQYSPSKAGPSPNVNSGWGRVNLTNSVNSIVIGSATGPTGYLDGTPLDDEEFHEFDIPVTESGATLKITLVWTDPPGAPGSGFLQNDLDLVVNAGGNEQHGNTGTDVRNNVQQVRWSDVPRGTAKVRVTALHLTKSPQAYACAWSVS